MNGVLWTTWIWAVALSLWYWYDRRRGHPSDWLNRESFAVILALLGTKAIAAATSADELLRDPAVLERIVRGGLAVTALMIGGPVLVHRLRNPHRGRPRGLAIVVAYIGVLVISTLYSAAPVVTGAKALEMTAGAVPVIAAALAVDGRQRLRRLVVLVVLLETVLLMVTVIGFFALPETFTRLDNRPGFVSDLTMTAPWAHSNYLSAIGALAATFALAWLIESRNSRQRLFMAGLVILGALGTILASGRQGVVILLISIAVLLWFRRRALFAMGIGPTIAIALWLTWDSVFEIFNRGSRHNLTTLTGRLGWWESALEAWSQHPYTGYGFGAGGRFVALANVGRSHVSNVHSGYVETLVGVGLLGALPLLIAVGIVVAWSLGALRDGRDVPLAILIVPMAIHTSVAQGFGGWLNAEFVLLVALVGIADWWRRDRRVARTPKHGIGVTSSTTAGSQHL